MAAKFTKRKDGRYCTHVSIGVDSEGKPMRRTLYARTQRELEEKAAELRLQVTQGAVVADENVYLSEWAKEWIKTYKSGVAYNTRKMYEVMINAHITPNIGNIKLKDIKPHHIQRLVNDQIGEGHFRTAESILLTVRQILEKAVENNLLIKNPAVSVSMPKRVKPEKRALTDGEKSIIEAAELDLKSRAFLYVLMYAGLRRGEALALMRSDINTVENTIEINKTLIIKGNKGEIKNSPKSKSGFRTIPIPSVLSDVLKEYLAEKGSIYVFPSASGTLMSHTAFRRFWEKIITRLNAQAGGNDKFFVLAGDITPHIFRHTYATTLFYAGVDIKTAQYLLGHSSISVTMDIYTHLDDSKTRTAVEKLNQYLSPSSHSVVSNKTRKG